MRAVLKRAAGGTEGQYSRFWIALLKCVIGGVEKDDYSVNETPFSKHRKRDQYLTIMSPQ